MSEICRNCPINEDEPDYPELCALAAKLAEVHDPMTDGWIYMPSSDEKAHNLYDDALLQQMAQKGSELAPEKVEQAQACAELICWGECEYANLEKEG